MKKVNVAFIFELCLIILEAIYFCSKDLPKLIKYVAVITFVSACTSEIVVEKKDNIIAINKLVNIIC